MCIGCILLSDFTSPVSKSVDREIRLWDASQCTLAATATAEGAEQSASKRVKGKAKKQLAKSAAAAAVDAASAAVVAPGTRVT